MRKALTPNHEADRLAALERYALLDSTQDPAYDAFTRLAAEICGTEVSLVSLVDSQRQWFKSRLGFPDVSQTPREIAFCTHAMASDDFFEVSDATSDARFAENPLVTGDPSIRFYAGVPLVDRDGYALGTLCTFDSRPQRLTDEQRYALQRLASSLVALIESRRDVPERSLEQQASFNAAFEFSADPVAVIRVAKDRGEGIISYVNRSFCDLFGYDPTSLIGGGMSVLAGVKTDPVKMARLRAAARTFEPGTETTFLYASTGAPRFVEMRERVVDAAHRILSVRDLTRVQQIQDALSDTNLRLQSLLANNSDAVLTIDRQSECVDANPAACALFGYEANELKRIGFLVAMQGNLFPGGELFPDAVLHGETLEFFATYRTRNERAVEMSAKAIPMIVRGVTEGAYLILKDVTEERRLARISNEQARRIRSLYAIAAAHDASDSECIDRALALVLEVLAMQYGYVGKVVGTDLHIENVVGHGLRDAGEIVPLAQTRVAEAITFHDVITIEDIARDEAARRLTIRSTREYHAYIAAPLTIEGKPYGVIGFLATRAIAFDENDRDFIRLVSALVASLLERQINKQRMDELAYFDSLTTLPNRPKLMHELAAAAARVDRHGGSFALHYIDLDGFKSVNDGWGHATGDEVLVEAACRLRAQHRPYDLPARLGGDEFVLVQSAVATPDEARTLGERIVATLSAPYETASGSMTVGASIGIAFYPGDARSVEQLLQKADGALYRAKASGKGRVAFSNERAQYTRK